MSSSFIDAIALAVGVAGRSMKESLYFSLALLLLSGFFLAGCSDDDGPTGPVVSEKNARLLYWKLPFSPAIIQSMNVSSGNVSDVTSGGLSAPVGGNRIALWNTTDADGDRVDVVDIQTGQTVRSFLPRFGDWVVSSSVAISPDGSKIVYTGVLPDGGDRTYRMVIQDVADSSDFTLLEIGSGNNSFARFSPDGSRIAFYSREGDIDREGDLNVVNADGTGLRILDEVGQVAHDYSALMDWSPDGNSIAYVSWDLFGPDLSTLYVIDVDGGPRRKLSDEALFPAWSPDGDRILYTENSPQLSLWVMNSDGTGETKLTSGIGTYGRWSPGGTMIACGEFATDISAPGENPSMNIISATSGKTIRRIDSTWCYGFWYE